MYRHTDTQHNPRLALPAILAMVAFSCAALSGCGGAGTEAVATAAAGVGAGYQDVMSYCGSVAPTGPAAQPGGLETSSPSRMGNPSYEVHALVSPAGVERETAMAQRLQVGIRDYRGVNGPIVPSGLVKPEWKMGIAFLAALPAHSAACVAGLAKLTPPVTVLPGFPASQPVGYTLSWRSRWSENVPLHDVGGAVVDGFEFVSTFVPLDAQVFFVLPKSRMPVLPALSVCHLAPAAAAWDCAAASGGGTGEDWIVSRPGARPGVYVLALR
jgi:hypothetical protein